MENNDIFSPGRKEKFIRLQELGVEVFPYEYNVKNKIAEIKERFADYESKAVSIAGRIVSTREHGKTVFCDLRDFTGDIQLYFRENDLKKITVGKTTLWNVLNLLDISDIIGVEGEVFKTKTGEITIWVKQFKFLSKNFHPIGFGKQKGEQSWYAVDDPEIKYRERYIYWSVYPKEREKIVLRTRIINTIREFMNGREFIEVQTPSIEMIYGGAEARPFETKIWALGSQKAFLRISPELYLKRYIVAGFPRVYTICQNFRNEGIDKSHNPEFSMMEWYEAYTDYVYQMKQVEDLVSFVAKSIHGSYTVEYQGIKIDFSTPWKRVRMVDAIKEITGFNVDDADDGDIRSFMKEQGIEFEGDYKRGLAISVIFDELCEDKFIQPTFIIDHPLDISPLTKRKRGNPQYVERFEPFVMGMEIGNAYSELTDAEEQLKRFQEQREMYKDSDVHHHPVDYDFIRALACGMPPTGGVGMGIDRIIMLLTDSPSIRDIIPFPMIKPKKGD
jgi:lysyl-tRNA synthetase class 2